MQSTLRPAIRLESVLALAEVLAHPDRAPKGEPSRPGCDHLASFSENTPARVLLRSRGLIGNLDAATLPRACVLSSGVDERDRADSRGRTANARSDPRMHRRSAATSTCGETAEKAATELFLPPRPPAKACLSETQHASDSPESRRYPRPARQFAKSLKGQL